ncbi:hypothetical protein [Microbacterium tenebrionis]|nr:hypothetical protein [Microbacterium tenebrionis]
MALKAEVLRMVFGAESLSEDTPLSVLFGLWIEDRDGAIRKQSVRIYKSTISWLDPLIGAIPIGEARQPLRVKRMLKAVEEARGEAALQQARVALNGAFAMAIENGVIEHNPMRSLRRQQKKRKVPKSLTVAQVDLVDPQSGAEHDLDDPPEHVQGLAGPFGDSSFASHHRFTEHLGAPMA